MSLVLVPARVVQPRRVQPVVMLCFLISCLLLPPCAETAPGGPEIDAFQVNQARVGVLRDMGQVFTLATALPSMRGVGMGGVDWDVFLASNASLIISCLLPRGQKSTESFVQEFCYLVSNRSLPLSVCHRSDPRPILGLLLTLRCALQPGP